MNIIGITRIRNEQDIIKDTLDHWAKICTGGIYVYDDASTDFTVKICRAHPAVKDMIEAKIWDTNRERAEWTNRQSILALAKLHASPDDWFVYFDADERLVTGPVGQFWAPFFNVDVKAIACRLYDVYITPNDVSTNYEHRDWVGPEFRTIVMFFRNHPDLRYDTPDQRVVTLPNDRRFVEVAGYIKHYGKGFSVKHWEDTCDYYINHFPKYAEKWRGRKGKAIKIDMKSDFGNPLISFNEVTLGRIQGFPLETQSYGKN